MMEDRVRQSFARQSAMTTIGARMTSVAAGTVTIELPDADHIKQQHGFIHGGIVGMIADSACGYSALSVMDAANAVLTSEYKINFLSPARGDRLVAIGKVLRAGRRMVVVEGNVYACSGDTRKHVAVMLATMAAVEKTPGLID